MNRILIFYPRSWQRRYLEEVAELLADRPPTVRDQIDLLLGAVDAWLHPQVSSSTSAADHEPIVRPSLGIGLAILAGLLWAAGGIAQHAGGYDPISGYKVNTGTMVVLAATVVSGLAAIAGAPALVAPTRAMRAAAVTMVVASVFALFPWPILVMGYWAHLIGTMLFGQRLHESGRRTGVFLVVAALAAISFNTESAFALAAVPLGLAWLAVAVDGLRKRAVVVVAGA